VHNTKVAWSDPCVEPPALGTPIPVCPGWLHCSPGVTCLNPATPPFASISWMSCTLHKLSLHNVWGQSLAPWLLTLITPLANHPSTIISTLLHTSLLERMGTRHEITFMTIGEISCLTCKALVNNKSTSKCWLVSRKNADTERCNWWNPTWWKN